MGVGGASCLTFLLYGGSATVLVSIRQLLRSCELARFKANHLTAPLCVVVPSAVIVLCGRSKKRTGILIIVATHAKGSGRVDGTPLPEEGACGIAR